MPIEEVVSSYIKLERSGKNLRARCPFHNEKSPSFFVSPDRGTYYCFGCGAKGDAFTFVSELEGLDFRGALKILAEKAGVEIENIDPKESSEKDRLFEVMEMATSFFEEKLHSNKEALEYLTGRGLEDQTIKDFRLGFARESWDDLLKHLMSKGVKEEVLLKAGLVVKKEKGGGVYDRFRGRIMFPLFDSSGRVVAFSGRVFTPNAEKAPSDPSKQAKYVNSPETPLFEKNRTLYGYHVAKNHMRKYDFAIVVEGQMDLLMSHQALYKNTVATSGTAIGRSHFEIVKRHTENVVLALDPDTAGEVSAGRAAKEAIALGMDVKVAKLSGGLDPADVIKEGVSGWKDAIKNALHMVDFYIEVISEREKDPRKRKKAIQAKVLPFIKLIPNKIDQSHFIKRASEELAVGEEAVLSELAKIEDESVEVARREKVSTGGSQRGRHFIAERIESVLVWQESLDYPSVDLVQKRKEFMKLVGDENIILKERDKDDRLFEAEAMFGGVEDIEDALSVLCKALEEDILKEKMGDLVSRLKVAEKGTDEAESAKLLEEYQDLLSRLARLKS